jgi:hypothetical protein
LETTTAIGRGRLDLRRFLQSFLSFEVVAFLHTGLLAFDSTEGFQNNGVQFVNTLNSQDISFAFRVIRTLSSPTLRDCC